MNLFQILLLSSGISVIGSLCFLGHAIWADRREYKAQTRMLQELGVLPKPK